MLAAPKGASSLVHDEAEEEASESPRRSSNPENKLLRAEENIDRRRGSEGSNLSRTLANNDDNLTSDDEDSGSVTNDSTSKRSGESPRLENHPSADWSSTASSIAHIFVSTSSSGDSCYLTNECLHSGNRLKCVACRIIGHEGCVDSISNNFPCRQTFREDVRKYREQSAVEHHWVQKRNLKGKCKHCGKAFQSKLGFGPSKEIVGLSCSWCKYSYHNKDNCLKAKDLDQECDLGTNAKIIVPPSWIVKLPRKGSFKSSLKNSPNRRKQQQQQHQQQRRNSRDQPQVNSVVRPFCIKPIPSEIYPVLVFLNPKSGGNQGAKLMQKFQWLLNPRQVFDLTQGGPQPAIEMFKRTPNVKLLACGGDGTVGWLLSVLDKVKVEPQPCVSVLPLGTGNDLSRSLGWGGGYIDEPISKILGGLQNAQEVAMDRWELKVTRNEDLPSTEKGQDNLPLSVLNNYFSFGVDAQIALQFHEAREANPQKFNSRIRNKMFYGQAGGKDLLLRKWKDLSDEITVECDGKDITPKLREHRVHSVLFANIPSFGSGTRPWDPSKGEQRIDDGKIEVIGLTTYQLPMLQAGSHGTCITQCQSAKITTRKTIPMQVDGEAVRLNPAEIELTFLNQVKMLAKTKGDVNGKQKQKSKEEKTERTRIKINQLNMTDYESHHYDKDKLKELAKPLGEVETTTDADLEQVRQLIDKLMKKEDNRSREWNFIDTVTAIRFFRLDKAQENLHYVMDISEDSGLYIVIQNDDEIEDIPSVNVSPVNTPTTAAAEDTKVQPSSKKTEQDVFIAVGGGTDNNNQLKESNNNITNSNNNKCNTTMSENANIILPGPNIQQVLEKTTEGVLKAARLGDLKMLTDLHNAGYSLLSIDETGKTALHYGARFGHKEIIKFLIANASGAILDMVDNEKGQTALHKAAGYKRRTICCMLVAAGASLLIQDHAGLVPRQLAVIAEDSDLASYLESQEHFQREKAEGIPLEEGFETPV